VKEHLENVFSCKLDYWKVYHEFRKLYPRFGAQDAQNFIEFIEKNGGIHSEQIDSTDQSICKLLFQTKLMHQNYEKFHDILLIDATYSTNHFSTPLVVLSGIDENYRNILFGLVLVNDETLNTYTWVLRTFFQLNQKKPNLIVSDSDVSLCSAIAAEAKSSQHRLCSWHVARNLRKNFRFLKNDDPQDLEIKEMIFSLPYERVSEVFEGNCSKIIAYLKNKELKKSYEYLENLLTTKNKWAISQHPLIFDAGVITTSRAESCNALIKQYVNSKSEISDLKEFVIEFEEKYIFSNEIAQKSISLIENTILAQEMKRFLSTNSYFKQIEEFGEALAYENQVKEDQERDKTYLVWRAEYPNKQREVKVGDRIVCNCGFFERIGLVCRHILRICIYDNVKSIDKLRIMDRWRMTRDKEEGLHFTLFELRNVYEKKLAPLDVIQK